MHLLYITILTLIAFILSPLLSLPILFIFGFLPTLILCVPSLLWRGIKWVIYPAPIVAAAPPIPAPLPIIRKPYKPRTRRSKLSGIRRNRAILDVAKGRDATSSTPTNAITH